MVKLSCILATKNRPLFLRQAIAYWQAQTVNHNSELIIVDDSLKSCVPNVPSVANIKYLRLENETLLGTKLNIGIERASGTIVQKMDDDDFYHPTFLETSIRTLESSGREDVIAGCGTFLVLVPGSQELRLADSGPSWFAGGTLSFYRSAWLTCPFRDLPSAVDVTFLEDHPYLVRHVLMDPELYILVRHRTNTWTQFPKPNSPSVTDYFANCPLYHRSLEEVVGIQNAAFYTEESAK